MSQYQISICGFTVNIEDVLDMIIDGEFSIRDLREAKTTMPSFNPNAPKGESKEETVQNILGQPAL